MPKQKGTIKVHELTCGHSGPIRVEFFGGRTIPRRLCPLWRSGESGNHNGAAAENRLSSS